MTGARHSIFRTLQASASRLARQVWPPVLFFIVVVSLWEWAARADYLDPMVLPAPGEIAANLIDGLGSGIYISNLQVTLVQAISGFFIACALGIAIGSLTTLSERLSRAIQPIVLALEATPKIALAPLIIVWFGYGMGSKVALSAVIGFFPVFIGTVSGLRSADPGRMDVLRALGARRWQIFTMVALPGALPHIFAGINIAVVLALLGTIVGEFMGSKEGLGTLILYANGNLDTARVFSILLVLAATGLTLHALVDLTRARLLFWDDADTSIPAGPGK